MTEQDIDYFMEISKEEKEHLAWPHFVNQMAGKQYGHDALWDAWLWYKEGWEDKTVNITYIR